MITNVRWFVFIICDVTRRRKKKKLDTAGAPLLFIFLFQSTWLMGNDKANSLPTLTLFLFVFLLFFIDLIIYVLFCRVISLSGKWSFVGGGGPTVECWDKSSPSTWSRHLVRLRWSCVIASSKLFGFLFSLFIFIYCVPLGNDICHRDVFTPWPLHLRLFFLVRLW